MFTCRIVSYSITTKYRLIFGHYKRNSGSCGWLLWLRPTNDPTHTDIGTLLSFSTVICLRLQFSSHNYTWEVTRTANAGTGLDTSTTDAATASCKSSSPESSKP